MSWLLVQRLKMALVMPQLLLLREREVVDERIHVQIEDQVDRSLLRDRRHREECARQQGGESGTQRKESVGHWFPGLPRMCRGRARTPGWPSKPAYPRLVPQCLPSRMPNLLMARGTAAGCATTRARGAQRADEEVGSE